MENDEDESLYSITPSLTAKPGKAPSSKPLEGGKDPYAIQEQPVDMPASEVFKQAAVNLPGSIVDVAKSTVHPFLHPIETAQSFKELGRGLYSKASGALGASQDPEQKARDEAAANAVGEYFADRYGSWAGFKKAFAADPAGIIADLSVPLTLGGGAAARAPGVIGKVGELAKVTGSYMDPITLGIKGTAAVSEIAAKNLAAPVAYLRSGASLGSLRNAFDAGYHANPEFMKHLTGKGSQQEVIDSVTQAVRDIAKDRSDEYIRGMGGLNNQAKLSYRDIVNTLDAAKNANIVPGGIKNQATASALAEAEQKINQWRSQTQTAASHTIQDMDGLKQAIDEIRSNYSPQDKAYAALTDVRKSIFNTIAAQDPKYAQVMESYADASRRLNDLRNEFRVNSDIPINKKMRAILNARDTVHNDQFLEQLAAKNPDIPYMIAGQELKEFWPYGTLRKSEGALELAGQAAKTALTGFDPTMAAIHASTLPFASPLVNAALLGGTGAVTRGIDIAGDVSRKIPMFVKAPLYGVGRTAEEAEDDGSYPRPLTIRPNRASGGRISAEGLVAAAERAKNQVNKTTEALLNHDDSTVARALEVANRNIEG